MRVASFSADQKTLGFPLGSRSKNRASKTDWANWERAIVDPDYLDAHARLLVEFKVGAVEFDLDDERIEALLENGLGVLTPGELGALALDFSTLALIREWVEELPPY